MGSQIFGWAWVSGDLAHPQVKCEDKQEKCDIFNEFRNILLTDPNVQFNEDEAWKVKVPKEELKVSGEILTSTANVAMRRCPNPNCRFHLPPLRRSF